MQKTFAYSKHRRVWFNYYVCCVRMSCNYKVYVFLSKSEELPDQITSGIGKFAGLNKALSPVLVNHYVYCFWVLMFDLRLLLMIAQEAQA